MSQVQVLKKISAATVFGKVDLKELLKAPGETIKAMRVLGLAISSKTGMSSYGEWTALLGQFQASNLATGEVFSGSTLFLPEVALTPILVALSAANTRGVEFAIDVHVKYVNDAKPGGSPYEYTFVPLLAPDANDPVSRLAAKVAALALEAPKGDATGEAPADKSGKGAKK